MDNINVVPDSIVLLSLSMITLSGEVLVDGAPANRVILIYKNGSTSALAVTSSNADTGLWGITVVGHANDRFRVVKVGESENSEIFENI